MTSLTALEKDVKDIDIYLDSNKNSTLFHSTKLDELRQRLINSLENRWRNRLKTECDHHINKMRESEKSYFQ